jgi:hypothetical protein
VAGNAPTPCDRVVGDLARTRLQLLFAPLRHTAGMPATTAHPRMHLSDLQPHCIDHGIGVRFTAILLLDDEPVAAVTGDGTASTTANRPTQPCMKPAPTRPAAATTAGPSPYRACGRHSLTTTSWRRPSHSPKPTAGTLLRPVDNTDRIKKSSRSPPSRGLPDRQSEIWTGARWFAVRRTGPARDDGQGRP